MRRAGRGNPPGAIPAGRPGPTQPPPRSATLVHQLCTAHLLRDLDDAAQVYPDAVWPVQIAQALRGLIHEANHARDHGRDTIADDVRDRAARPVPPRRAGRAVRHPAATAPAPENARPALLLEVLRDRPADVLRFAHDLKVPPTSNQAERDLRPSKIQQNISGRLTSEDRTRDRYTIRGYVSTAIKHGLDAITVLRDALTGRPGCPHYPPDVLTDHHRTPLGRPATTSCADHQG